MIKGRMEKAPDKKTDPRRAVFGIVSSVLDKGVPLDEALETAFANNPGLELRDRALVKNLVTTLFRNLGIIDRAIVGWLKKPLPAKAAWVKHWLRIGAVQILFLNIPDHAAVNTTVEEIARTRKPGAKAYRGLANALLRNFTREKDGILKDLAAHPDHNLPRRLKRRWEGFYGPETVRQIAAVLGQQPPLDITLKNPGDQAALAKALMGEEIFDGVLRLYPSGPVENLPGFKEGAWWVQDIAASLPARLVGDVRGKRVLDLCAAPGGKTLYLASRGADATALDISKTRLQRLKENLERTSLEARIVYADVLEFQDRKGFDAILLDAPCSATGTLRRHPDVAYLRKEKDILRLAGLQQNMLSRALTLLKRGGVLVYCVCSLEAEEGREGIEAFLKANTSAKRQPISAGELENHKEWLTPEGDLRTLPCHLADKGGMDGFFAARLVKSGDV